MGAGNGSKKPSNITSVKSNGLHIENPKEMSNTFNNFFVNIAAKIKEPVAPSNHDKLNFFCNSRLPEDTKFSIKNIEKDNVLKFFQQWIHAMKLVLTVLGLDC